MKNSVNFPMLLRLWIKHESGTVTATAKRIGISRQMLTMYISGAHEPRLSVLNEVAAAFGVDLPEFLKGPPEGKKKSSADPLPSMCSAVPFFAEIPLGGEWDTTAQNHDVPTVPVPRSLTASMHRPVVVLHSSNSMWWQILPGDWLLVDIGRKKPRSMEIIVCTVGQASHILQYVSRTGKRSLQGFEFNPFADKFDLENEGEFSYLGTVTGIVHRPL